MKKGRASKIININNITKSYNKQVILKQINMSVKLGEIYGLIGISGSGKSTLLRCINGIDRVVVLSCLRSSVL